MRILKLSILLVGLALVACQNDKQSNQNQDVETDFAIDYEKFTLDNGLEVILHKDDSDPIVAVATIMHVGSNREKPGKTGFAHFFEHMSFNDSETGCLLRNAVDQTINILPTMRWELFGAMEML